MSEDSNQARDNAGGIPADLMGTVYNVVATRRTAFDTMMWQVPALGLTAQAFLLTIAYGGGSSDLARDVAGFLALVVAGVAIQTMSKHRANEKTDSLLLEAIEARVGIEFDGAHPHSPPSERGAALGNELFKDNLVKRRSFDLWILSLRLFALAGIGAVLITLIDSAALLGK
jgi:hypothetical protein